MDDDTTQGEVAINQKVPPDRSEAEVSTPNRSDRLNLVLTWVSVIVIAGCLGMFAGYRIGQPDRPAADSVEVGFTQDMIDHHDQATQISLLLLAADGVDARVRDYAQEVIIEQRYEVGVMSQWLADWGQQRGDLDRVPMVWMGTGHMSDHDMGDHDMSSDDMSTMTVATMDGMQSKAAMDALRKATGADAAQRFLAMMIDHHQGGIAMAKAAVDLAQVDEVRTLAQRIVKTQVSEITEYRNLQTDLGFPVSE